MTEDELFGEYRKLHDTLALRYESREGGTRATFFLPTGVVVKVPFTMEGLDSNYSEASWSEKYGKDGYIPIAEAFIETWDGLDVLIMERVTPLLRFSYKDVPDWVGSVDCGQVGYDSEGVLVAYDL